MATIVVFTEHNARIYKGVDPSDYKGASNIAIDPDLSQVAGIPPHGWQLVDGKILPLPDDERVRRESLIGHDNSKDILQRHLKHKKLKRILLSAAIAIAAFFLGRLV